MWDGTQSTILHAGFGSGSEDGGWTRRGMTGRRGRGGKGAMMTVVKV